MLAQEFDRVMLKQHLPHALKRISVLRSKFDLIPYTLKSFLLFTYSDLKTIVGPCTVFAILQQLGTSSVAHDNISSPQSLSIVQIFKVICWTWLSLLPFNIDNQRRSVTEDLHNKPWRPLPAGRMTPEQATMMMIVLYPISILFGILVGAPIESIILVCLGFWYNDLGGANGSWIMRNFINACGITCFLSGALSVMLPKQSQVLASNTMNGSLVVWTWLAIIGCVIFSGIQTQDMYDQVGDRILNRKTMPLVLGDQVARWTIAVPVLFWSVFCPLFWSVSVTGYIVPVGLGVLLAKRTLTKKSVQDDKLTSKLWNLWLVVFFTLPLHKALLA